ncbi:hypothetical protein STANM309S_04952 [Streptomyces tanashiensis]
MPRPVRAETAMERFSARSSRCSASGSAASALLTTTISGTSVAPTSLITSRTAASCSSGVGAPSTTCRIRSESPTSSIVERNASTRWCGRCRTKPTVSASVYSRPLGVSARRTVGSRVANSAFSTGTPAPVRRLSSEDLPALV